MAQKGRTFLKCRECGYEYHSENADGFRDGLTCFDGSNPNCDGPMERYPEEPPEELTDNSWEANAKHLLSTTPASLRVTIREGGGDEDVKASLVTTFMKMRETLTTVTEKASELVARMDEIERSDVFVGVFALARVRGHQWPYGFTWEKEREQLRAVLEMVKEK